MPTARRWLSRVASSVAVLACFVVLACWPASARAATFIDVTGCPAGALSFGSLAPPFAVLSAQPCAVGFGDTTGQARLDLVQQDGTGAAMPGFADYGGGATWNTGSNAFGACLESTAGGLAAGWTVDGGGSCTASDSDPWNGVPTASGAASLIATSNFGATDAVARVRFGLRGGASMTTGAYAAPLTIAVASFAVNTPPAAPTLVSPADGARTASAPTFTATFQDPDAADTGTVGFELCASAVAPTPAQTCVAAGGTVSASGSSSTVAVGANGSWTPGSLARGSYFWRARGTDAAALTGPWTATRTHMVDTAPSTSTLVAPANGVRIASMTPTLQGRFLDVDAGDSGRVEFELCTDAACATVVQSGSSPAGLATGATGSWTVASLTTGTTYYWRARGTDVLGVSGSWSATRSLPIDALPGAPTHVSPADSTVVTTTTPNLIATFLDADAGDSGTVTFQVCSVADCSATVGSGVSSAGIGAGSNGAWTVSPALSVATTYWWRARGTDSLGAVGSWSTPTAFAVNAAPSTPSYVQPANAATNIVTPLLLTANFIDTTPFDTGMVRFQICTASSCAGVVDQGTSPTGLTTGTSGSWTSNVALSWSTVYYWRAQNEDANGLTSAWTAARSFTTAPQPPATIATSSATGSATVVVNKPAGATTGDLVIAYVGMVGAGSFTPPAGWGGVITSGSAPRIGYTSKIMTGAEPATYSFTVTTGTVIILGLYRPATGPAAVSLSNGGSDVSAPYDVTTSGHTTTAGKLATWFPCFASAGSAWAFSGASWTKVTEASMAGISCALATHDNYAAESMDPLIATQGGVGTGGGFRSGLIHIQ
ncbi:MAG: A-macroglobulin complement component [Thermoleophilia bacterium]|nr:A-macroglobulin complement component [Thermoleophilia bacterium]